MYEVEQVAIFSTVVAVQLYQEFTGTDSTYRETVVQLCHAAIVKLNVEQLASVSTAQVVLCTGQERVLTLGLLAAKLADTCALSKAGWSMSSSGAYTGWALVMKFQH